MSLSMRPKLTAIKLSVLYSPLPSLVLSLGMQLLMRIGLLPRSGIVASYFRSLGYCSRRSRLQCCICWKRMKHMANLVLKKWMLAVTFHWCWRRCGSIHTEQNCGEMCMRWRGDPDTKWFSPGNALSCSCHILYALIWQDWRFMYARRLYVGMCGVLVPTWVHIGLFSIQIKFPVWSILLTF